MALICRFCFHKFMQSDVFIGSLKPAPVPTPRNASDVLLFIPWGISQSPPYQHDPDGNGNRRLQGCQCVLPLLWELCGEKRSNWFGVLTIGTPDDDMTMPNATIQDACVQAPARTLCFYLRGTDSVACEDSRHIFTRQLSDEEHFHFCQKEPQISNCCDPRSDKI